MSEAGNGNDPARTGRHLLLVKTSSLGDVVHTLPALTDAATRGFTFDWVVEEAFTAIARRHPAVRRVIPIGWRRWRSDLVGHRKALRLFHRDLRQTHYPLVLDAQGLLKSAVVSRLARGGRRIGLDWSSAREGAASLFYGDRIAIPRGQHAVDRLRALFAAALDYRLADGAPDFGLQRGQTEQKDPQVGARECLLLHGTTWETKHWPEAMWIELARRLRSDGWRVSLPWGNPHEAARAARIAAGAPGTVVLDALSLDGLIDHMAGAELAVGVDSGLSHLAAALSVPTVVLYGSTDAALTGCRGARVSNLQSPFACAPCLRRTCSYRGAAEIWNGEPVVPACYARLTPDDVWSSIERLLA